MITKQISQAIIIEFDPHWVIGTRGIVLSWDQNNGLSENGVVINKQGLLIIMTAKCSLPTSDLVSY